MTVLELLELFQLPTGQKLNLMDYEKDMLIERAKEYKMPKHEYSLLLEGITNDIFDLEDKGLVYNLEDNTTTTIKELSEKYNITIMGVRDKLDNKRCFNGIPYSKNKNDIPMFYQVNTRPLYECSGFEGKRPAKCWKKIFNDDKLNISYYSSGGFKYQGKYTFKRSNILYWEVV